MPNPYYRILFEKYVRNACSDKEESVLHDWFGTPEGQQFLAERMDRDMAAPPADAASHVDHEIRSDFLFHQILTQTRQADASAPNPVHRPSLVVGRRKLTAGYRVAAAVAGLLVVAFAAWWLMAYNQKIVYQTAFGETRTLVLPDQSSVILNGNSTFTYRKNWHEDTPREVWLEGEAFFSVRQTPSRQKFFVRTATNEAAIEVIGTTFNVRNRRETMDVVLNSGTIHLHLGSAAETPVVMQPGERVAFDAQTARYVRQRVNPDVYSSWKNEKIVFDNTSLRDIVQRLQETYGFTVEIADSSLLDQKFTGSIPNENVDLLLEGLSQLFDLKITRNENRIQLQQAQ